MTLSSLAYPNLLGKKGYVVVVVVGDALQCKGTWLVKGKQASSMQKDRSETQQSSRNTKVEGGS